MTTPTVTNLTSPRSGKPVTNQYEIVTEDNDELTSVFQSYRTVIAKNTGGLFTISSNWNYSVTTSKYFTQWLRSFGLDDDDIRGVKDFLKTAKDGDQDNSRSRFTIEYRDEL